MNEQKVGQVILTELLKLHSRCYFDRAPVNTTFPFVVFRTPSSFQNEDKSDNIVLEIDIWDNKGNKITDLLNVTKAIESLHKTIYTDNDMLLKFERESTLQVPDTEEQLRRRQIRFNVKYYNKEA